MFSKKFIFLFTIVVFMQSPLWAQIEPAPEIESPEEVTDVQMNLESPMPSQEVINAEDIEDMDNEGDNGDDILLDEPEEIMEDEEEAFLEEEINDEEEAVSGDQLSAEEGNKGYVYGTALTSEESQKPPKKSLSLWQQIIKMDEWFQEKFW